jgi:hypothetical protein
MGVQPEQLNATDLSSEEILYLKENKCLIELQL